ncbi:MAG: response regulator [Thermodesulfobacteriota bacterium]|nr:response regulator [Thermodesulfobacteriota bacterium]
MTGKQHKILLVDDEKKFLETMSERSRLKGFEPLTAASGQEALDIAQKETVYAAVVDLKMPDMDGLETINKLKEIQPDVKTVLLTGFGDEKTKEAAEAMDAAYFEKDAMGGFWEFLMTMGEKRLNILLVDDEKKFLDTIADRIRLKGFEPLLASSGKEALDIAKKEQVYAAVVDLKMPDMDGLVTITKLKEIRPNIKTVLLTGFGDDKVQEAAEALDAAYFEKDAMGGFWNFMKRLQKNLENSMVAATMGGYEDSKSKSGKGGND